MKAKPSRNIYLVGFSGSGKSTIARLVGEKLQWTVCDLDELIVERSGMTIPEIFQREGEPGFRRREAEALREASGTDKLVVATGGGTVVQNDNRSLMARTGWIIGLEAQPRTLLTRIQQQLQESDPRAIRPLLDSIHSLDQIEALKRVRQAAYGLADRTVDTDGLSIEQVAVEVIRAVEFLEQSK